MKLPYKKFVGMRTAQGTDLESRRKIIIFFLQITTESFCYFLPTWLQRDGNYSR